MANWDEVVRTTLPQYPLRAYGAVAVLSKADGEVIVAGYASPQVVDREKHLITKEALAKDLPRFLEHPHYRNAMLLHSNVQVGEVLPSWTDAEGKVWETKVDDVGLFSVVKIRTDSARPKIMDKVLKDIEAGRIASFSISADAPFESRRHECKDGTCFWIIDDVELYEVTLCETPVNQDAKFAIISKAFSGDEWAASSFCQDGSCPVDPSVSKATSPAFPLAWLGSKVDNRSGAKDGKVYLKEGEKAPEGAKVEQTARGARYYWRAGKGPNAEKKPGSGQPKAGQERSAEGARRPGKTPFDVSGKAPAQKPAAKKPAAPRRPANRGRWDNRPWERVYRAQNQARQELRAAEDDLRGAKDTEKFRDARGRKEKAERRLKALHKKLTSLGDDPMDKLDPMIRELADRAYGGRNPDLLKIGPVKAGQAVWDRAKNDPRFEGLSKQSLQDAIRSVVNWHMDDAQEWYGGRRDWSLDEIVKEWGSTPTGTNSSGRIDPIKPQDQLEPTPEKDPRSPLQSDVGARAGNSRSGSGGRRVAKSGPLSSPGIGGSNAGAIGQDPAIKASGGDEVRGLGERLGINWGTAAFSPADFAAGIKDELKGHGAGVEGAAEIAFDRLARDPDYYRQDPEDKELDVIAQIGDLVRQLGQDVEIEDKTALGPKVGLVGPQPDVGGGLEKDKDAQGHGSDPKEKRDRAAGDEGASVRDIERDLQTKHESVFRSGGKAYSVKRVGGDYSVDELSDHPRLGEVETPVSGGKSLEEALESAGLLGDETDEGGPEPKGLIDPAGPEDDLDRVDWGAMTERNLRGLMRPSEPWSVRQRAADEMMRRTGRDSIKMSKAETDEEGEIPAYAVREPPEGEPGYAVRGGSPDAESETYQLNKDAEFTGSIGPDSTATRRDAKEDAERDSDTGEFKSMDDLWEVMGRAKAEGLSKGVLEPVGGNPFAAMDWTPVLRNGAGGWVYWDGGDGLDVYKALGALRAEAATLGKADIARDATYVRDRLSKAHPMDARAAYDALEKIFGALHDLRPTFDRMDTVNREALGEASDAVLDLLTDYQVREELGGFNPGQDRFNPGNGRVEKGYGIGWLSNARRTLERAISELENYLDDEKIDDSSRISLQVLYEDMKSAADSLGFTGQLRQLQETDEPELEIINQAGADDTIRDVKSADSLLDSVDGGKDEHAWYEKDQLDNPDQTMHPDNFKMKVGEPAFTAKADGGVAGLAVIAGDTGRMLMLQRALDEADPAAGTWEFPGGHLKPDEVPEDGAAREWREETGKDLPPGQLVGKWHSGPYDGFVYRVDSEDQIPVHGDRDNHVNPDDPGGDNVEALAWWSPDQMKNNPAVRKELLASLGDVVAAIPHELSKANKAYQQKALGWKQPDTSGDIWDQGKSRGLGTGAYTNENPDNMEQGKHPMASTSRQLRGENEAAKELLGKSIDQPTNIEDNLPAQEAAGVDEDDREVEHRQAPDREYDSRGAIANLAVGDMDAVAYAGLFRRAFRLGFKDKRYDLAIVKADGTVLKIG